MFGDFRGPAFVGFMLAAFVLCGYSALWTLSTQPRFHGLPDPDAIQQEISRQRERIDELVKEWVDAAPKRELIFHRENQVAKLERMNFENRKLRAVLDEKENRRVLASESLVRLREDFGEYVEACRSQANGEILGRLRTNDGRTYEETRILEVADDGIHFRHRDGTVKVPSAVLPLALRERFRFGREKPESRE